MDGLASVLASSTTISSHSDFGKSLESSAPMHRSIVRRALWTGTTTDNRGISLKPAPPELAFHILVSGTSKVNFLAPQRLQQEQQSWII